MSWGSQNSSTAGHGSSRPSPATRLNIPSRNASISSRPGGSVGMRGDDLASLRYVLQSPEGVYPLPGKEDSEYLSISADQLEHEAEFYF